ncbi:MAG: dual specificity protein phosphatase family protein [Nitrospira sp.]|nr:dual specificity protein phosphatase family protein [Nitrospira sp.]
MHQITERLFVGNIYEAASPPTQIGALLWVAEEYDVELPAWLSTRKIPLKEFTRAEARPVADAVAWIDRHIADNRVMVCCRAGMSRSVSVIMAYLCCAEGWDYDSALRLVKTRRPGAMPLPQLEETIQLIKKIGWGGGLLSAD